MAYCIMRFQKLKAASWGSLAGSLSHTLRSRYTPNADPELIKDNKIWLGPESTKEVVDLVRERWPEKHRKDAVGCIEYFIGASPEWFKKHGGEGDQEQYFRRAIQWLKAEYGEENVISVVQHNDETSPHLAAYVVPVDEYGKLNAKKWTGGRAACARMQTRFHEAAGEPVGLERGIRGSKAEHLTIQQWYEQNATLDEQRREIKYDTFDLVAREAEVAEDLDEITSREKSLERREQRLGHQENDVTRRGYELDDREETLLKRESKASEMLEQAAAKLAALADREQEIAKREAEAATQLSGLADKEKSVTNRGQKVAILEREVAQKAESLSNRANALSERENTVQSKTEALEQQSEAVAKKERQLSALERELAARGERLAGGEEALLKRQAEIDAAGTKLQQRLDAVRQQQEDFNQRRAAWLESNRPQVPPLVQKLLAVQEMGRREALEFIYENFEIEEYYNPVEGLSPEAKALIAKHAGAAEEVHRWERTVEPHKPSGPSGP